MRHNLRNLALVFFCVVATALPVWASEITAFKIEDVDKKIRLTFEFSGISEYSTVSDFNSNILILNFEGLEFSNKQKAKDHRLKGDKDFDVLRFVRFQGTGEQAEVRVYLGWEVTPADAQVIAYDDRIEVDILKPLRMLTPDEASGSGEGEWEIKRDPESGEAGGDDGEDDVPGDEPDTSLTTPNPDSTTPENGSGLQLGLRQPDYPEIESGDGTVENGSEPVEGVIVDAAEDTDDTGEDESSSDFRPAREFTSTPSYKKFDLDEVEVKQLEFRSVPFNEALLDLVAGTGFNVVVGEGIDDKKLTLNFTKKKMTLKSALYILCTAYDLEYTVEDDAIVIRAKN